MVNHSDLGTPDSNRQIKNYLQELELKSHPGENNS
jgi:hypothetical protein